MFMIKEFPHYSDASIRQNLKYIRGRYNYRGEAFWWHLLEWLNQHDAEPIDLTDPLMMFSTCEYIHPLEVDVEKREAEVLHFLDFCSKFQGRDGSTLIDPELWEERRLWSHRNFENQQKILKRRKGAERSPVPPEVTAMTKRMHHDIVNIFGAKRRVKWNYTWDDNLMKLLKDVSMEDIEFVWSWLVAGEDKQALWWRQPLQSTNALNKHFAKLYQQANNFKPKSKPKSIFA
jgi:hypothetical protein